MKRRFLIVLAGALLMLFLLLPAMAETSGTCGENLTWSLNGNTLTISGTGDMQNYGIDPAPWSGRTITSAILTEGVTTIGNYAFTDNENIRSVVLPESLTSIGNSAFWGCSGLQSIRIPENVTNIAIGAFGNCFAMDTLEVAEQNSAYTAVDNVLYSKDMTRLLCCSGTKTGVFRIPQSVAVIYACAFSGCVELTEVIIPENVPQINNQTFQNCVNLQVVQIPQSVQRIFNYAFDGCYSLEYIYYQGNSEQWNAMTIDDGHNDMFTQALVTYESYDLNRDMSWSLKNGVLTVSGADLSLPVPWDNVKDQVQTVILQEGVTSIVNSIFEGHSNLLSVNIPSSVTSLGGYVFSGCENLTEIKVASGNTTYSDIDGVLFGNEGRDLLQYPAGKTDSIYNIPASVTWFFPGWSAWTEWWQVNGGGVFKNAKNLIAVMIPTGVASIPDSTFYACEKLTSVTIPASVTQIGGFAFGECGRLETVQFMGTKAQWKELTIAYGNDMILSATVQCSDGVIPPFSWSLNNGVLTISGTEMPNYDRGQAPWQYQSDSIERVVINEGVVNIGDNAFINCNNMYSIQIPNSIQEIGKFNFQLCGSLWSVKIPDSVTTIDDYAFSNLDNLRNVTIPSSVTRIGTGVFTGCTNLANITVDKENLAYSAVNGVLFNKGKTALLSYPAGKSDSYYSVPYGVTTIGDYAFSMVSELSSLYLPDSLTSIGKYAFQVCEQLNNVQYFGSNEQWNNLSIGTGNDSLTSADISFVQQSGSGVCGAEGNNLTWELDHWTLTISGTGAMAHYDEEDAPWRSQNSFFTSVVIQEGVTSIGKYAFFDSWQLEEISLPESVVSIGNNAFSECPELIAFHVAEQNSVYTSLDDVLYSKDMKTLIKCPGRKTGIFHIPESVTTIAAAAFVECKNLTEVTIPDTVTSIENAAFRGCSGLANHLMLPSGLTILNLGVFKDCGFESVEIPQNVQTIGSLAFTQCYNLQSVIIPVSVTEIQEAAFDNCGSLQTVYYAGTSEQWNEIAKADNNDDLVSANIIYNATSGSCGAEGSNLTWELSGGTLTISGTGAMQNYGTDPAPWSERTITNVVLNEGVTSVGNYAFCDQENLQSIELPDSLISIGNSAFYGCWDLKSIRIPKNVTAIAAYAFGYNYALTTVEVAEQNSAFTAVENVLYSKDQTTLVFCSPGKRGVFRIPESVTVINAGAFHNCSRLTEVIIPENVTQINRATFGDCYQLKVIQIPQSVEVIQNEAFIFCDNLQYVYYQGNVDQWNAMTIGENNDVLTQANKWYGIYDLNRDMSWNLENGVLTVSGEDLSLPVPWDNVKNQVQTVILQEGVNTIVTSIFEGHTNLRSVSIPASVTSIDGYVFSDCEKLTEIKVASGNTTYSDIDGVLFLGEGACLIQYPAGKSGSTYTVPNNVTDLFPGWFWEYQWDDTTYSGTGGGAFRNAKHLSAITIPNRITSIPSSTFYGCENLNSVTIPASVTEIGGYAFGDCWNLENIIYSGTKAQWKEIAVANGNDVIKSATVQCSDGVFRPFSWSLENGVLTISGSEMPDYSYDYENPQEAPWYPERENIVSVVLDDVLVRIGNNAFFDCYAISSVNIPDSVKYIGEMAFYSCTSLTNVTIPQSVLSIGYSAFNYCTSLTSIVIPASVTEIGAYAFTNCTGLTEIRVAQGNTTYSDVDGVLFGDNGTVLIQYPAGSTRTAYVAPGIVTFLFPGWSASGEGWHVTGGGVFTSAANLREVTIPAEVQIIPDSTFYECSQLTSITIPASVTEIGGFAFYGCANLGTIHYGGSPEQWETIIPGNGNDALVSATVIYSRQAVEVNLTLPAALTTIESEAFADIPGGTKVYIPATVTEIAADAFGETAVEIFAETDSYAVAFAQEHGYSCVLVED